MAQEVLNWFNQTPATNGKPTAPATVEAPIRGTPFSIALLANQISLFRLLVYDTKYPRSLWVPDTMKDWPFARAVNPLYEEVKAETIAWCRTFKAFSKKSQYAFERCDFCTCLLSKTFSLLIRPFSCRLARCMRFPLGIQASSP
jgi:hypothetical protein